MNFPSQFFKENRQALLKQIEGSSSVLVQSAESMVRHGDTHHRYKQDPDFFYLTGITEPNCFLLLAPENVRQPQTILFIPPVDPEIELWQGQQLTVERAQKISGIEHVMPVEKLETSLYRAQRWQANLYCQVNDIFVNQPLTKFHLFLHSLQQRLPGLNFKKLSRIMARLRAVKKPIEIQQIKKSIEVINQALQKMALRLKPGITEYQVEAELIYHYLNANCRNSFEPIVATGKNATVLHYTENMATLHAEDLLLVDTGAEYNMYTGDITRVFPVSQGWSERQLKTYQAVLEVQELFLKDLKVGQSWNALWKKAEEIQEAVYTDHGFVQKKEDLQKIICHRIGHSLGLDTHDPCIASDPLQPGAVITVEPGLYLPNEGIGIRIEDNILLEENGYVNLSSQIPKQPVEIETLLKG